MEKHIIAGIPVYLEENHNLPTVAVGFRFEVGSNDEEDYEAGYAHIVEHLMFKGPKNMSPNEFIAKGDSLSLKLNAHTSKSSTLYHFIALKEVLYPAFEMFLEALVDPAFRQEEIDVELNVILEEWKMHESDTGSMNVDNFFSLLYPNHPYGNSIIGKKETIELADSDTIRAFYNKHYKMENVSIFVVGDTTVDEIKDMISFFASRLKSDGVSNFEKRPSPDKMPVEHSYHYQKDEPSLQTFYGIRYKGEDKNLLEDKMKLNVLSKVLSAGMSSPLFFKVRVESGLAYHIGMGIMTSYPEHLVWCNWSCTPSNNGKIKEMVDSIIKDTNNITEERLEIIKRNVKMDILLQETNYQRMNNAVSSVDNYNEYHSTEEIIEIVDRISLEDLKDMIPYITENEWVMTTAGNID